MREELNRNTVPEKAKDEEVTILQDAIQKVAKVESTKKVKVIVHMLNVRQHANQNSAIVTTVRSGDVLTVNNVKAGEFYQVVEPVKGYVNAKFVG